MYLFVSVGFFYLRTELKYVGFPGGTRGKQSACQCRRRRDLGSVPGLGRSPGGGQSDPPQYSCPENPMARGPWWATVHGVAESDTTERLSTHALQRCPRKAEAHSAGAGAAVVRAGFVMLCVSGCRTCQLLALGTSAFAEPGMFFARSGE